MVGVDWNLVSQKTQKFPFLVFVFVFFVFYFVLLVEMTDKPICLTCICMIFVDVEFWRIHKF